MIQYSQLFSIHNYEAIIVLAITLAISNHQTEAAAGCPFSIDPPANANLCGIYSNSTMSIYTICCKAGYTLVGGPNQTICQNGVYTQTAGQCVDPNAPSTQAQRNDATTAAAVVVSATLSQTVVAWCFTMLLIAMRLT